MFAVRFQHGFCHAAAGAAVHLRATPVLKASPFVCAPAEEPPAMDERSTQRESMKPPKGGFFSFDRQGGPSKRSQPIPPFLNEQFTQLMK
jgi:hypothetical protein